MEKEQMMSMTITLNMRIIAVRTMREIQALNKETLKLLKEIHPLIIEKMQIMKEFIYCFTAVRLYIAKGSFNKDREEIQRITKLCFDTTKRLLNTLLPLHRLLLPHPRQPGVKTSTTPDVTTLSMCVPVHALVDVKLIVPLASLFAVKCDRPGAVCQDPRFIGGDGITFYFHGKKDHDFCLVSDPNLHINAHFIGKRNENLTRDFTWVQSISIFFDKHQLFLGALKASTWDDSADRLSLAFDGEPLNFPGNEGSKWQSTSVPSVSITRISDSNNVVVEVEGLLKITAKVVPITEEDSRIHNYGITSTSTFQRR
ncbi:hypothetical protein POTOM_033193 [Populus tomentosa]|uniref:Uncharacterized protein n=1 Tax=Populus tomentosa TaxID=118781 RepID=A0A8X8CR63_POPTO|nr:hypothetical protein POTOM_033193 [Populus tomentosa]